MFRSRISLPTDGAGTEGRRARSGERIDGVRARHFGNGFVRVAERVDGLTIEDLEIDDVYRVLEVYATRGQADARLTGLTMRHVRATKVKRAVARIRYDSSGGTFSDVTGEGMVVDDVLPGGIIFEDTAHDFTLDRCVMRGFRQELGPDRYWNGDGFSSELGNYGLRYLRCEAYDNTDGGFDLKSSGTFLDGCVAGGNKYNYRFWSTLEAHVITSLTPVPGGGRAAKAAHVQIVGRHRPVVRIGRLVVRAETTAPILQIAEPGATVIVAAHDIRAPKGTPIVAGDAAEIVWTSGPPRL